MWYKEWTTVRSKFYLWLLLYFIAAFSYTMFFSPYRLGSIYHDQQIYLEALRSDPTLTLQGFYPHPMFEDWGFISLAMTILCAILGGADIVAEEADKNTISFLLTRSVTRQQIYTSKLLVNIAALATASSVVNFGMLVLDQTNLRSLEFWVGLVAMLVILLAGTVVICVSGLVSVFTRTTVESLLATVGVLLALYGIGAVVIMWIIFVVLNALVTVYLNATGYRPVNVQLIAGLSVLFGLVLILLLIFGTYKLGLYFFQRKQF
jgi:ABC-type transport system involved in multi-copper enzyme maturation permease subunit